MERISLFSCALVLIVLVSSSQGFIQELFLYDSVTEDGNYIYIRNSIPDTTSLYNFETVKRICARGSWNLFSLPNFNGTRKGVGYSNYGSLHCVNETFPYKSLRHIAASETDEVAVSLYVSENGPWSGTEIYITQGAVSGITQQIPHYGLTGKVGWLFFEGPNFDGTSACAQNIDAVYSQGYTTNSSLNPKLTTIGSVFRTCDFGALEQYKASRGMI